MKTCKFCKEKNSNKAVFCQACGKVLGKLKVNIGNIRVSKAFDNMGIKDSKMRSQILEELRYGMRPKEEVIRKENLDVDVGSFEK